MKSLAGRKHSTLTYLRQPYSNANPQRAYVTGWEYACYFRECLCSARRYVPSDFFLFFFFASVINKTPLWHAKPWPGDGGGCSELDKLPFDKHNQRSPLCGGAPRVSVCLPPPSSSYSPPPSYRGSLCLLPPAICMHTNHVTCISRTGVIRYCRM